MIWKFIQYPVKVLFGGVHHCLLGLTIYSKIGVSCQVEILQAFSIVILFSKSTNPSQLSHLLYRAEELLKNSKAESRKVASFKVETQNLMNRRAKHSAHNDGATPAFQVTYF